MRDQVVDFLLGLNLNLNLNRERDDDCSLVTAEEVGRALLPLLLTCKSWKKAVEESKAWSGAKVLKIRCYIKQPLIYSIAMFRQLPLLRWAGENLCSCDSPITSMKLLLRVADSLNLTDNFFPRPKEVVWYCESKTVLECIKEILHDDIRLAFGEPPLHDAAAQIEYVRSSGQLPEFLRKLTDLEAIKWMVATWKLEKRDFVNAGEYGALYRLPFQTAIWLHETFLFTKSEALGQKLDVLSSAGEMGYLEYVKWIIQTYDISALDFRAAGSFFEFETIKLAAGCGELDVVEFLASHFEIDRQTMVDYVLESGCQSTPASEFLEWFHERYTLTAEDMRAVTGLMGTSALDQCILRHDCESLSFLNNELSMRAEVATAKAEKHWDREKCEDDDEIECICGSVREEQEQSVEASSDNIDRQDGLLTTLRPNIERIRMGKIFAEAMAGILPLHQGEDPSINEDDDDDDDE